MRHPSIQIVFNVKKKFNHARHVDVVPSPYSFSGQLVHLAWEPYNEPSVPAIQSLMQGLNLKIITHVTIN